MTIQVPRSVSSVCEEAGMLVMVLVLGVLLGAAGGFLLGKRASTWCPGCGRAATSVSSVVVGVQRV